MKSKFFGFNAKLALAVLAISGTMFTSCYESEGEDVGTPYTPPAALYTISGTVTDVVTGRAIEGATVKFTGASEESKTTDAGGAYYLITEKAGTYSITVSKDKYTSATAISVNVKPLSAGQSATYLANAVLEPTDFQLEGFTLNLTSADQDNKSLNLDAAKDERVDYVNDKTTFMDLTFEFKNVEIGGQFKKDDLKIESTRAVLDQLKVYMNNYLVGKYGALPVKEGSDFKKDDIFYSFQLAPKSSLKSLSIVTKYRKDTYDFSYAGKSYQIIVLAVVGYEFSHTQFSNDIYHGHGHGNDLNAGGGIIEGI